MTVTVTDNVQNDNRSCSFGLASSKLGFHFRCRGSSKIYLTNQLQKKKKKCHALPNRESIFNPVCLLQKWQERQRGAPHPFFPRQHTNQSSQIKSLMDLVYGSSWTTWVLLRFDCCCRLLHETDEIVKYRLSRASLIALIAIEVKSRMALAHSYMVCVPSLIHY